MSAIQVGVAVLGTGRGNRDEERDHQSAGRDRSSLIKISLHEW
ncbi:hypothetical protein [Oculatella sp. LEGE 06141]|nr:hypothetical protein [Oculatella sp. LEGE 06141]